ncbi:MAG TPA: protein phosphatase 2C domain-containing protein, partial [Ktedonobacteraceae bacterium]
MQAEANSIERVKQAYVAYRSVRLLCVLGVLVSAPALVVLAGGFPPYAWRLLAQGLAQLPALLAARGLGVLLALVGALLLSFTQFIAWGVLFWLSWKMFAYWRYERRELRAFAAEVQEAQFQSGELDESYKTGEEEEDESFVPRQVAYVGVSRAGIPAARRSIIYPLAPPPQRAFDEDAEDQEEPADESEQFFVEEDEEEDETGIYRDEEDEEDEMDWIDQQAPGAANAFAPMQAARPEHLASEVVYDPPIVEHSSQSPAPGYNFPLVEHSPAPAYDPPFVEHSSRPPGDAEERANSVHYSSYGRVVPFSAAPSAGALPHLTTSHYAHVSMPHSVSASGPGARVQSAPAARTVPAPAPQRPSAAPPRNVAPTQPALPNSPAEQARPALPAAGAQVSKPRVIAPRPTGKLPAQRPPTPKPAQLIAPEPAQRVQPAPPPGVPAQKPEGYKAPQPVQRVQPGAEPSAMQSLVELITTVPMTPPVVREPQPMAPPVTREPQPMARPLPLVRPDASARPPATQLVVSTGLDVGLKRRSKPNEDSLLALQNTRILRGGSCPVGLFVVADGMGGHDNGKEASNLVIQSLSKTVVPAILYGPADDDYSELLAEGVHHANLEVYQRNRQSKADMGTTLVAALVIDSTAYVVSAGDSRVYLYRPGGGLTQVTRDHSTVARLVENGLIKPEDVYTHPRRNEIYRSLGHHPSEDLD